MNNAIVILDGPAVPARRLEAAENNARGSRRRRAAQLHRGAQEQLDAAIEARRDSEEPAREFEVERAGAVDIFAWRTRRIVRELQSAVRGLENRVVRLERWAA